MPLFRKLAQPPLVVYGGMGKLPTVMALVEPGSKAACPIICIPHGTPSGLSRSSLFLYAQKGLRILRRPFLPI